MKALVRWLRSYLAEPASELEATTLALGGVLCAIDGLSTQGIIRVLDTAASYHGLVAIVEEVADEVEKLPS